MLFYLFACCIREHTHALYFAVGSKGSSIAKHNIKLQYLWITKHRICIVMLLFLEWTYEKVHIVLCTRIRGYGQQEKTKQDYSHSWMNREKKKKHQKLKLKYFAFHIFDLEIQLSHSQLWIVSLIQIYSISWIHQHSNIRKEQKFTNKI